MLNENIDEDASKKASAAGRGSAEQKTDKPSSDSDKPASDSKRHQDLDIVVGQLIGPPFVTTPSFIRESDYPAAHAERPWVRAWLARNEGVRLEGRSAPAAQGNLAILPGKAELKHYLLAGASGSGKTRLALHILRQQMEQGCSVVCMDPKLDTIEALVSAAREAGIPPERVTLILPQKGAQGAPGWNVLTGKGLPVDQAAADFVSILAGMATSWGPRMNDILISTLVVVGEHGLSLYEADRFLSLEEYRAALLARPYTPQNPTAYQEARNYFINEFNRMSPSERNGVIAPVKSRLREILRSEFFQALLCPKENTLDLFSLWHKQGAVFVHLDRTSLGDDLTKLLGGLIAQRLYRTAMRSRGPVPVVFSLDELGAQARFVGRALIEIVTVARSQGIRLLAAFQNLEQLEGELLAALLGSTAARIFFRLSYADARLVASSLSTGAGGGIQRLRIGLPVKDTPYETWEHPILDPDGELLRLDEKTYQSLGLMLRGSAISPLMVVDELAMQSGIERLYVRTCDTGEAVELAQYVAGIPQSDYFITGPDLRLVVRFPHPRMSGLERFTDADLSQRWVRAIQDLKTQHAVFNEVGTAPEVIRVADVAMPVPGNAADQAYIEAALAVSSPFEEGAVSVGAWRDAQIERVTCGESSDESRESNSSHEEKGQTEGAEKPTNGVAGDGSI
ncbi:type IV secretory system conjugative DNA transfer family protein [Armatimonas rosea]|uniref:TraD/TraG TraM recognition site domain-containing protein n=1 Tax=Armatimonas rosea TaxID=685828 RepID=A0A7W9SVY7_ARMRO|nr:TraM recognition domain-containing protein [Armatimonas rosea]MBB6053862.1 hypothetical protein [Armatimonas rosea]